VSETHFKQLKLPQEEDENSLVTRPEDQTNPSPVVSNGYTSQCSGPYWSNIPFLIFLTFWYSGAQDWAPECQNVKKIKKGGLNQYGAERFDRLLFATIRKSVELKGLNGVS